MTAPLLKALRRGLQLDTDKFSEVIGVDASTIAQWEKSRGHIKMRPEQSTVLREVQVRLRNASGR
jgi:DNA-binding transcriptional regulator YiaG